jgi:hypothetical protein
MSAFKNYHSGYFDDRAVYSSAQRIQENGIVSYIDRMVAGDRSVAPAETAAPSVTQTPGLAI